MSKPSRIYLHLASIGNADACAAVRATLRPVLKAAYARGEIRGYRLFMLNDRDAAEEELLHRMFDYLSVTEGRFPIIYASITPSEHDNTATETAMHEQGFQRFR